MNIDNKTSNDIERITPDVIPDDNSGFYFSSFVKIVDPNTQEVLVEIRGDQ